MEKEYGAGKVMYRTAILEDGYLEVQVLHANQNVRKLIDTHTDDPKYFSDNIEKFTDHKQRARKWLADVVIDYRSYFDENRVTFEMIDL